MLVSVNWTTVSSLATGGGTLVLAIATFASVRSANRAARISERALQVGLRPVLFASRLDDPEQKIRWGDDHWAHLLGGRAAIEESGGNVYMAMSLRNVGSGIAVLQSWRVEVRVPLGMGAAERPAVETFRAQTRDLYVPSGDISFWQAAMRDADDPERPAVLEAIMSRQGIFVDLLYSDHEGGQRTISRFLASPRGAEDKGWHCSVVRHWYLDRAGPR